MKKRSIKYLLGLVVTGISMWFIFGNLDWSVLKVTFSRLKPFWIVLAMMNTLISVFILGWRWKLLLKSKADIPIISIFQFNIISQYVNIITQIQLGEILKAWLVSKRYSISGSYVLGTVVIEKIVQTFIILILAVLTPIFFTFQTQLKGYMFTAIFFIVIIPLLVISIYKWQTLKKWLTWIAKVLPGRIQDKILNLLERGVEAFIQLRNLTITIQILLISVLVIISQVITNLLLFKAYGFKLSLISALVLQLAILIGMAIPSVPGKIGVFEYTVILVLSMFNIEKSIALSFGLMLHVIAYLPKIILGIIFMIQLKISLKKTEKELDVFEESSKLISPDTKK